MNTISQSLGSRQSQLSRRDFLQVGGLAAMASPWLRSSAAAETDSHPATLRKRCSSRALPPTRVFIPWCGNLIRRGNHRFGQSLLLARRLAEGGVRMIAVHFNHMTRCDGWDTHAKNVEACGKELLPMLDQRLSALIDDLESRGLLDETVVACFGEFGRTPRINAAAGRDHCGPCSSAFLAGGGIQGGRVIGASDRDGAYPRSGKVDPVDLHASIFHCLGIDSRREVRDELGRPLALSTGEPIHELL